MKIKQVTYTESVSAPGSGGAPLPEMAELRDLVDRLPISKDKETWLNVTFDNVRERNRAATYLQGRRYLDRYRGIRFVIRTGDLNGEPALFVKKVEA